MNGGKNLESGGGVGAGIVALPPLNLASGGDGAFRFLFEHSRDALVVADDEGRFLDVNPAACELFGYTREEMLQMRVGDLVTTHDPDAAERYRQYRETGQETGEFVFVRPDSEIKIALYVAGHIAPGRHLSILQDITAQRADRTGRIPKRECERRQREADQKRSEEERARLVAEIIRHEKRLSDMVASVPGVVWEAWGQPDAANQRINFVSDHVEKMLGYTVEEWLSTPNFWLTIVHPDDREKAARRSMDAWARRSQHINEFRWMTKDGRAIPVEAHSMVIQDADGQPLGMRGVTLDVSERHRAVAALRLSEARISLLNQRLHRAVYESSHRIKNHLQILAATVDLALMSGADLLPAEHFQRLGGQIRTLSVLQDILTLEWKDSAAGVEMISSKMLLERVLGFLQETTGGGRMVFRIAEAALPVRAATALALIANEATSNAIKYGKRDIEVGFRMEAENCVLEVCDGGPGFPDGFDPVKAANTGLELISLLAEGDLQGTVRFSNRATGGAQVTVTFPYRPISVQP